MALKLLQAVFIFHFLCTGGFVTSVVVKSQSNYLETQSNSTIEVNALVAVLPPFTHFDSNRGFGNHCKTIELQVEFHKSAKHRTNIKGPVEVSS